MRSILLAVAVGLLLGGCSAGVAPAPVAPTAPAAPRPHSPAQGASFQELAVTEYTDNSIQVFNNKYQIVGTRTERFDDVEEARAALARRNDGGAA